MVFGNWPKATYFLSKNVLFLIQLIGQAQRDTLSGDPCIWD